MGGSPGTADAPCDGCWFVVLPDREPASRLARRLTSRACHVLPHASGRPWLVGCWGQEQMITAEAGPVRLAVAGVCSLTPGELGARAAAVRTAAEVPAAVAGARGSFHLLASVDGEVYGRGTATGDRRLYRAEVTGVTVAADRARTLAWLTGARPDPARLAARLVPPLPYPLEHGAMWAGVATVPPGHALRLGRDGSCSAPRWWRPPPSDLPLAEAAPLLREALRGAVAARVAPGRVWGADLSGGMDSTSLCFLAAEAGARLVAVTLDWSAPTNQDAAYARLAAGALPGLTHLVFRSAELPGHFTGLNEREEPGDTPTALLRDRAQQGELVRLLREHGARRRLSGHGGDHVVTAPAAYLHRLVRRHPVTGLRHLAAHRARARWPLGAALRELAGRRSPERWLVAQAHSLATAARPEGPRCDWNTPLSLPPWATGHAVDLLAGLLREAAAGPFAALAPDRGTHAWAQRAQSAGARGGEIAGAAARAGLPIDMPFCDDAVVEACLRARPEETGHPAGYKPLLAAAMRGIVPEAILARTTKDHCDEEWRAGLTARRRDLAAWAGDSRLVAAGLADPGLLRRALLAPEVLGVGAAGLECTLGTEAWLRDLEAHPHPAHLREHAGEQAPGPPANAR
ncbi:asparagine synthase-related protein [Streptomyces hoynatensis]|uniref:Asparagine synthetase B family protein n=1 Tax=Streptomyces hoynatensis TaxID=1141874 RepID=A0A3A9Z6S9_9ACTN|nr:asparagine synthase-related protein [Streptomyces hoynatensis]RKN44015.1 asparagine synthetase B family protein [Streptomyces hoynatensis]